MNKYLPYLIVFLISTGAAAVMVTAVFFLRPDLLTGPPPPVATADSTVVAAGVPAKTGDATGSGDEGTAADSTAPPQSVSPTDSLHHALAEERARSAALAEQLRMVMDSTRVQRAAADSAAGVHRAAMAKVLEAMDPASAARILADFPDEDVKQMILTIKKRQAAKILAALDPDRAARIMR